MYHVQHSAYCGMVGIRHSFEAEADARAYAAKRVRAYRQVYAVTTLETGADWEILEPDNAVMVPDACGTLSLWRETFECQECGSAHDTQDQAYACCTEEADPDVDDVDDDPEEAEEESD